MTAAQSEYPFPAIPNGWHGIAFSEDIGPGQVLPIRMLGRDLVVYRGEDGEARVLDAFCPHLGAHLGHGGKVVGNEIECPFHAWRWSGSGECTAVPYAKRIPSSARIGSWESRDRNGFIFVWYHDRGEAPSWEIEEIPETRDADYEVVVRKDWPPIRSHPQEIAENGVDLPHFRTVHGWYAKSIDWRTEGPIYTMAYELGEMPERWSQEEAESYSLQSLTEGPTFTRTRFWGAFEGVSAHCFVPVEEGEVRLMQLYYAKKGQSKEAAQRWFEASDREWAADMPIWDNKRHLARPMLTGDDGPVPKFRRWYAQFYSEAVVVEDAIESDRNLSENADGGTHIGG
jgi:phenylpropionate dioxygenase-like ring-hydroxylating dioxygenase large terminal subunit